MATITYTVVRGDSLKKIAAKYNTTIDELVRLNNIKNKNLIYVGQVLTISTDSSTPIKEPENLTSTPIIVHFGLQADTDRTIFATWSWNKEHTKEYETKWYYDTGDDIWFIGSDSTASDRQSIYNAPANATRVRFVVRAVSETYKVNDQETRYWVAGWSTEEIYNFSENPPVAPSAPNVEIKDYTLTATLNNIDKLNATHIEFQVYYDNSHIFSSGIVEIVTYHAAYTCTIEPGRTYKVCCRSLRDNLRSAWSPYSEDTGTKPAASAGITVCRAESATSVYLEWEPVANAESYDLEYTTELRYFDGSDKTTTTSGIQYNYYTKTGIEKGDEYFFRVRAVNSSGSSPWSEIKSVVVGKKPIAPTTWSSTTTGTVGESIILYWIHNAEDESLQTAANIELEINGEKYEYEIDTSYEEDDDKTMHFTIDTSKFDFEFEEGATIKWRVQTKGAIDEFGDWSIQRSISIYAPPTLSIGVTSNGQPVDILGSFPFMVSVTAGPITQKPISYHLSVMSDSTYETVDSAGNVKMVSAGQEIYSKHVLNELREWSVIITAGHIDLENNAKYTVRCVVSMDSGLTAEASSSFTVAWTDIQYEPNAEISVNRKTLTASIRPFCMNGNELVEGVTLSVYRREYDGSFTELATGIPNNSYTFITDPHPSLDLARYRVVAITETTGAVSYCDIPGYPVGETAIVLQWNEKWSNFDVVNEDALEQPTWSGSMLKLPYNVDVSDNYSMDVSLVQYIGRKRPVTYYGTQLGESGTWNVAIPATDRETLYALRRLAIWTGDVYVREPSGTGYWANVSVSFSQKHRELTIPVTINVTRVEGGV